MVIQKQSKTPETGPRLTERPFSIREPLCILGSFGSSAPSVPTRGLLHLDPSIRVTCCNYGLGLQQFRYDVCPLPNDQHHFYVLS